MTTSKGPNHVVVDGSNIATEGRSLPSLAQLSDAVMAFMEEHPDTSITVVVDATFGHRIDKKEAKEFEEGISNNELVAPPAGAVGRGDAFVLSIAQKANAAILSNDSFQEFHGDYEWLFDEGRLIGGKPVPHVGWVFVDRLPVRGPVSRKATGSSRGGTKRGSKRDTDNDSGRGGRKVSAAAMEPMPVPKSPPPGRKASAPSNNDSPPPGQRESSIGRRERTPNAGDVVNELMPFLEFVEHHPVGTSVNGTVESYSSHGAYISIGENGVRGYVPLRLMANPTPTSARKVMQIGESVTVVVVSFAPLRRSIDCAVPDVADAAIADARAEQAADTIAERDAEIADAKRPSPSRVAAKKAPAKKVPAKKVSAKKVSAKKVSAKKVSPKKVSPKKISAQEAPARNVDSTRPPAKKAAAKKALAKKAVPITTPAKKASAEQAPAAKISEKKAPVKNAATRAPAKRVASTTVLADKPPTKKAPAKKAAGNNAPADSAPTEKAPAKKAPAKKAPAKKAPAKKAPAEKAPAGKRTAKKASPSDQGT